MKSEKLPREQNIFFTQRQYRGISIRNLSKLSGISRYTLQEIENGNFDNIKLKDLINLCKYLNINILQFLRTFYQISDNVFDDGLEELVNELIKYRIEMGLKELTRFCKNTKVRITDFDLVEILSSPYSYEKLIILNKKLESNKISIREALENFKPKYLNINKRKSEN